MGLISAAPEPLDDADATDRRVPERKPLRMAVAPTIRLADEPSAEDYRHFRVSARAPLLVARAIRPKPSGFASVLPRRDRARSNALRAPEYLFERDLVISRSERRLSFAQRILWKSAGLAGASVLAAVIAVIGLSWVSFAVGVASATASLIELRLGWARLSRRATALTAVGLTVSLAVALIHVARWALSDL